MLAEEMIENSKWKNWYKRWSRVRQIDPKFYEDKITTNVYKST